MSLFGEIGVTSRCVNFSGQFTLELSRMKSEIWSPTYDVATKASVIAFHYFVESWSLGWVPVCSDLCRFPCMPEQISQIQQHAGVNINQSQKTLRKMASNRVQFTLNLRLQRKISRTEWNLRKILVSRCKNVYLVSRQVYLPVCLCSLALYIHVIQVASLWHRCIYLNRSMGPDKTLGPRTVQLLYSKNIDIKFMHPEPLLPNINTAIKEIKIIRSGKKVQIKTK